MMRSEGAQIGSYQGIPIFRAGLPRYQVGDELVFDQDPKYSDCIFESSVSGDHITLRGYKYQLLVDAGFRGTVIDIEEETGMYTILTAKHFNTLVEGMLSLTPDPTNKCETYFRAYEIGEKMRYDEEKMQADIEKYGLYTYEDFDHVLTYEQFVAFNVQYFKIAVGKGEYTYEGILALIDTYLNN